MKASLPMQQQVIQQYCKQLRVPTIGAQFRPLAEAAINQQQSSQQTLSPIPSHIWAAMESSTS